MYVKMNFFCGFKTKGYSYRFAAVKGFQGFGF